jgi:hypothetical protein
MTSRRRWLAGASVLAPAALLAQVAILESVAGSSRDGVWRLRFRTGPAARMKAAKATLLLHVAGGKAPASLEILKPVKGRAAITDQREGWITARLDPRCAQRLIDRDDWLEFRADGTVLFHLPSQTGFAPYLVAEGAG